MADRTVAVRLRAEVSSYVSNIKTAERATRDLQSRVLDTAKRNEQAFTQAGTAVAGFGAATLAGLGLATRAAMEWETAWAGVRKTVDGSDAEMAALEQELRGLATTLPATHREIAAVAEAAGQLGISREGITEFTRTMIDLGETTNLTADEAATAIAQMANVMGTSTSEVDNLGSTLVALGNDGASTERQIIQMSQRIAGAAAVVGLAESDVLALANTVASMGIEVEAGGTSVSRVLTDMSKAAQSGGEELAVFAETAGMSAQEFARAFQEDPAEAFAAFIGGLGQVQEAGGNVFAVLEDLGLADVRVSQALLGMASAGDLLTDSLELGSQAWQDNSALVLEASKRYETAESRIQVARNQINDAAIDLGAVLLPIVADAAEAAGDLATAFGNLPAPVQGALAQLGGIAGVASVAAGGMLLLLPRIAATRDAARQLASEMPRASRAMRGLGAAAAGLVVLELVGAQAKAFGRMMGDMTLSVEGATEALLTNANGLDAVFTGIENNLSSADSFEEALDRIHNKSYTQKFYDPLIGALGMTGRSLDNVRQNFESVDRALTQMVTGGHLEQAAALHEEMARRAEDNGQTVAQLNELLPGYQEALAGVRNEQRLAENATADSTVATDEFTVAAEGATEAMEDERSAAEKLSDAFDELNGAAITARETEISFEEAVDDVTASVEENGRSLDINTAKGRANERAVIGAIKAANDHAQAVADQTGEVNEGSRILGVHVEALRATMRQAGFTEAEIDELIGTYARVPTKVETPVSAPGVDSTIGKVAELRRAISALSDKQVRITVDYDARSGLTVQRGNFAGRITERAMGGAINGPGGPTDDVIPAWLSNGEHVWTAREVANAGGHAAVEAMRQQFRFAAGGPVVTVHGASAGDTNHARIGQHYAEVVSAVSRAASEAVKAAAQRSIESGAIGSGPWRKPLSGYRVSSEFGQRWGRLHAGIDLAAPTGTPVYAASSGRISAAGWGGGYGNRIDVAHAAGVLTRYAHLSAILKRSGAVNAGQLIGRVGSTGNSTGPHLHFETRRNGSPSNPRGFMSSRGVRFAAGGPVGRTPGPVYGAAGGRGSGGATTPAGDTTSVTVIANEVALDETRLAAILHRQAVVTRAGRPR